MSERLTAAFQKLDDNKDGFVTLAEIKGFFTKHGIAIDESKFDAAFPALDKDGDGKLSQAEFNEVAQEPHKATFLPLLEKVLSA